MKEITKQIPEMLSFRMNPDEAEEMDQKYPYMHNLMNNPTIHTLPDPDGNSGDIMIAVMGYSDHMDDLKNAIFYGGLIGRGYCHNNPAQADRLSKILLIDLILDGGVEGADPKDGILKVTWPHKTIRFQDKKGNWKEVFPDIDMVYTDMQSIASPDGDLMAQTAYLLNGGDPELVQDEGLKEHYDQFISEMNLADLVMDEEQARQKHLDIWKDMKNVRSNLTVDLSGPKKH